jgi:membrane protease YdiL (CAAX protease family)
MEHQSNTRPLGVWATILYWAVPAGSLYVAYRILLPEFVERTGQPYWAASLMASVIFMVLFFLATLVAYRAEGNPLEWKAFAARYQLRPMSDRDWAWSIGVYVLFIATYYALGFTATWLARWSLFAPHPLFADVLGPGGAAAPIQATFMGTAIAGLGWVSEELWFRGYILPRQEKAFGKYAWIANGLMFALNDIGQPSNLLRILPGALAGAFAVQRRKNTSIQLVSHILANAIALVLIIISGLVFRV